MVFLRVLMAGIWAVGLLAAMVTSWAQYTAPEDPAAVLAVLPGRADALDRSLRRDIDRQVASGTFEKTETAGALLQVDPLSEWPFVQAGLFAAHSGDSVRAEDLMRAANRRNPRNLLAIGWLAQMAAARGDGAAALGWLDRLVAINPQLGGNLHAVALEYTKEEGGLAELAKLLASGRGWAGSIVGELNRTSDDVSALLELNRLAPNQQSAFVERLLRERGPQVAFIAWVSLLGDDVDPATITWPIDPGFDGLNAPRPFNWMLDPKLAEMGPEDGLYTVYFGRGRPQFARQVMMLRPGPYRFVTDFDGQTREAAGHLVWEIACLAGKPVLASLTLENPAGGTGTASAEFDVPPTGCTAQQLVLKGVPGEFPARIRIATSAVRIEQVEP